MIIKFGPVLAHHLMSTIKSLPWSWKLLKWLKHCISVLLASALQCCCHQAYWFLHILSFLDSLEVKEHLRPPTDSIHKDSEEHSEHWARRRKLFKESKQRSSAGGSSITSNITEESGIHLHIGFKGSICANNAFCSIYGN